MKSREIDQSVYPYGLMIIATILMMFGVVMVGSASVSLDRSLFDAGMWRTSFGRQIVFVAIGFLLMMIGSRFSLFVLSTAPRRQRLTQIFFYITVIALLAALLPGLADPHRGSNRWLDLNPVGIGIGFQPSEVAKLAMVAFLSVLLTRPGIDLTSFRSGLLPPVMVIGVIVLLVGSQDFGTAALISVIGVMMLFIGGCRPAHLLSIGAVGFVLMLGLLYAAPYRLARLTSFRDIWADPQGAGYQQVQSLTTIANGGWFGRGIGSSIQKYGYLPEAKTDFIFSLICEETGVLGGGLVIILFCMILALGVKTVWSARSRFERLLAFGLTAMIVLQAAMHMAVVTVLAPATGISLPFISAGGSGLLTSALAIGVLSAIARRSDIPIRFSMSSDDISEDSVYTTSQSSGAVSW